MQPALFSSHVEAKYQAFLSLLEQTGWEHLVISSGSELVQFRDDLPYPFKVNPYFKEWLPLTQRACCYLLISENEPRPKLLLKDVRDIWHSAPEELPEGFDQAIDVHYFSDTKELFSRLPKDTRRMAYLGPKMTAMSGVPDEQRNPQSLINRIDWLRGVKSPYEQAMLREANRIAVPGHRAAEQAFREGKSEKGILLDYLRAMGRTSDELPYPCIIGLNENAALLHHCRLAPTAPSQYRSLLIDAGADMHGYASDITRTYAADGNSQFAGMIEALDSAQQQIIPDVEPGVSYVDLHRRIHRSVAHILKESGVLKADVDSALERRLTTPFLPHGLGHFLGVQVHDKGGHQLAPDGGDNPPPVEYPGLRLTRTIEVGQVMTIEPGLYFIPQLLQPVRDGEYAGMIDWQVVEGFIPYGGIRIEDNVLVTEQGVENFTRDAFAAG